MSAAMETALTALTILGVKAEIGLAQSLKKEGMVASPPLCGDSPPSTLWKSLGLDIASMATENKGIMVGRNIVILEYWLTKLVRVRDDDSESSQCLVIDVRQNLRDYVTSIADLYNNVPFHSFEHASHVLISAHILMRHLLGDDSSMVSLNQECYIKKRRRNSWEHFNTYGIPSNPLAQFTFVFAALVHDVEHGGLSNRQLVKEDHPLAMRYNGQSVLEQNSITVSYELLMQPKYKQLQDLIFSTPEDRQSFRSLLVDLILTTDIGCEEQTQVSSIKWQLAFPNTYNSKKMTAPCQQNNVSPVLITDHPSNVISNEISISKHRSVPKEIGSITESIPDRDELKANVILTTMIQICDVAHTIQDFTTFLKWNSRLYDELNSAHSTGKGDDFKSDWYNGQINFLGAYVVPLARRLHSCGILGELGCDMVQNAIENQRLWIVEGREHSNCFHQENLELTKKIHSKTNFTEKVVTHPTAA